MKIALVGELWGHNLGEPLLFQCCKKMIEEKNQHIEVEKLDFFGREEKEDEWRVKGGFPVLYFGIRVIRKICEMLGNPAIGWNKWEWLLSKDKKRIESYFDDKCQKNQYDGIIIMGAGTIKYDVRLNFGPYYKIVLETAERYDIPVYINCAGIESKYNSKDSRCNEFSECLSKDILRIATTRDDIGEFKKYIKKYIKNPGTVVEKISDIGVWAAETFQIKKQADSEYIGLGMITPERFREFGRKETYIKYENLWLEMIEELEKKGIKWRIFNNGDICDRKFAEKLCSILQKPIEQYVLTPETPEELVRVISGFKGIITSRLHSCIIAYSLGIPFVAISWNNKLHFFAQNIGVPERVIEEGELDKNTILDRFFRAVEEGYDMKFRDEYRKTSREYIAVYLRSIKEIHEQKKGIH